MLIYTSPKLGSVPWLQLTYYGHIRSVDRSAGTCEFSWVVVGDIESGRYLNAANSVISYLYVSGYGEVSCTSHVSYAGAAANRTGPYKWLGAADSIIPISSTQQYITITRVRSTSPTMGSTGIQGSTTINVKIPIPVTSVTNVVNTPYLGSGPSIRHCHYANCIRRTSTSAVIGFDDCAQFSANGAALAGVNQLQALLTVNGSTVTIPVKSWYGSAGSYQTGSTAMFGVSWLDPSYSVSATTTSIPVTRTGSTSINMSSSGIQSWTSVSARVTIPRFTYMSFSRTTLGSTMTITINSINNNNVHTHTITFNGSTDSASTSKSRTRALTASTFGPMFSSTSATLSLPVTVTSYDYQGSLGSYTQNVTITMPEQIGRPIISNLSNGTVTEYGQVQFTFEYACKYNARIYTIDAATKNGYECDCTIYSSGSVGTVTVRVTVPDATTTISDILQVSITDSRRFVSDALTASYNPSLATPAPVISNLRETDRDNEYVYFEVDVDLGVADGDYKVSAVNMSSSNGFEAEHYLSRVVDDTRGVECIKVRIPDTNEITSDTLTVYVTNTHRVDSNILSIAYTPMYGIFKIYYEDKQLYKIYSADQEVDAAYYGDKQIFKTFG